VHRDAGDWDTAMAVTVDLLRALEVRVADGSTNLLALWGALQFEAAYTAARLELINKLHNPFRKAPVVEETRTEAGWPCTRATLVERAQNGSKPLMTSIALIHWPERQLLFTVMVEGEIWSASEAASLVLRDTFQKSAQGIHLSLGPAAVSPKPGTSASQAQGVP